MSLVLNVEILGEFRKLTEATNGASKQLAGMNSTAGTVAKKIGKAFATIGVGLSFAFIAKELKQATKAAVEDRKSQELLALALQNTTGATDLQVASVEKSISKMTMQSAVADDELRPAFANLVRATGDITKSTDLMNIALDISAGTGKNLDTVVKALSKAVGPEGTTGALERLVPAIKGASDPMATLDTLFGGAAEKAANLDPYAQMKIAFDELSESVGLILIPLLEDFAKWVLDVVPDIQEFFAELNDPTSTMGEKWQGMIDIMILTGEQFQTLLDVMAGGAGSSNMVLDWITSISAGFGQIMFYGSKLAAMLQKLFSGDYFGALEISQNYLSDYADFVAEQNRALSGGTTAPSRSPNYSTITLNFNNPNMTAKDIVTELNKSRQKNGQLGLLLQ